MPLPDPVPGLTVSHGALSLAVHVSVPPVTPTVTVWLAGFAALCVAAKVKLDGLTLNVGAAVIVKVTGMVTADAPVALRVMTPLRVPVAKLLCVALIVMVPLPVPDVGETVSHETLSFAVHDRVPPPVLLMVKL